ncbi:MULTISPECIES: hypothetical protein [unclassified Sphingomonas]|uniref:hypothetical protein n=1 Tax=unclassified Sphingomonas TaxID=196159 RepID=UPI0006F7648F|nr:MULTISPECIES: hypothetical protein [unclassified Sphingomonas]KQM27622.1 hypothetical protein ASE58_04445 [Sphingomonas sp. Leaf9]KQM43962.1 hypothetical protein ASE57_04440 [Sphingomonas sp. Leaf11]
MRAILLILPLLLSAPAAAQIWDGGRSAVREMPAPRAPAFDSGVGDVNRAIRDGRRRGDLSRSEARALYAESVMVERLARQARGGGPAFADTAAIDRRVRALREQVAAARARPR